MKLIFEKSVPGRTGVLPGPSDVPTGVHIREDRLREHSAELPELSELDVVRHFTELSRRNFGVDTNFYPLGSCTMKYNPKVCERIANYPGFCARAPAAAATAPRRHADAGRSRGSARYGSAVAGNHRHGRLYDAAAGRCARRTDRHDDHGRLPPRQGQQKEHRPRPRTALTAPTPPAPRLPVTGSSRSRAPTAATWTSTPSKPR